MLRDLTFASGDELLTTTHAYGAIRKTLLHMAAKFGATVVEADVPFPSKGDDEIVAAVLARVTSRTRLLVIDHIRVAHRAHLSRGAAGRGNEARHIPCWSMARMPRA